MKNEVEASGDDASRENGSGKAGPPGRDKTRSLKPKNREPKSAANASIGSGAGDLSDEPREEVPGTKAQPATSVQGEPATSDATRTKLPTVGASVVQTQEAELIDIKVAFLVKLALEILDGD
jgi:hypothetical protein